LIDGRVQEFDDAKNNRREERKEKRSRYVGEKKKREKEALRLLDNGL